MTPRRLAALAAALAALAAGAFLVGPRLRTEEPAPAPAPEPSPAAEAPRANRRALFPEPRAAGAAALEPVSPWVELNNEATLLLAQGELALAVEAFERCVAGDPTHDVFARNLVEALVRLARSEHEQGELASATLHLERAIELGGEREDLETLRAILDRWRREAEVERDHWVQDSELFELSYDTQRADILRRWHEVLAHLEHTYETLRVWFGVDPVRERGRAKLRVVLYDREQFDRLTGLGDWAGGVFDGIVRVSVEDLSADGARWRGVLMHELVHAFVQECGGPSVPGWLNEGLAQLFEGPPSRVEAARARLEGETLFSLAELQGSLLAWRDTESIARAYAQSLAFVAYLQANYGDEVFRRMLRAAAEGTDPGEAFTGWTRLTLEQAFSDWAR